MQQIEERLIAIKGDYFSQSAYTPFYNLRTLPLSNKLMSTWSMLLG